VRELDWQPDFEVDVQLTLSVLAVGAGDPCQRVTSDGSVWKASLMETGAATLRVQSVAGNRVRASAWGPGADEAIGRLPELLGSNDDPQSFSPDTPLLREAARRLRGLRIPRSGRLLEALIPAVLHQKISGRDASASWSWLVRRHGEPAPGPLPFPLRLPPSPEAWLAVPQWDWRRAGVEPSAVTTIRLAASRAGSLERVATTSGPDHATVYRALTSLAGIGRWTCAEVGHRALGDSDALSVGDYNLPALTSFALAGRELSDAEVEGFYERWRPHRYRVTRLLELTPSAWPPRRGPRMSRPEHRHGW